MIITKTPMRMSFAGGGSDLPSFYRRFGGAVVSTAIDKHMYITVYPKFDAGVRASYSKTEEVAHGSEIKHPLIRAALELLEIDGGVEISSMADIPKGTGLGSSSAFTVGLLHALSAFQSRFVAAEELARTACHIEIEMCGDPIGKQDQYAAAYGGLNFIEFHPDDSVSVEPIICPPGTGESLQSSMLVFYTGKSRQARALLAEQDQRTASQTKTQDTLKRMVGLARDTRRALHNGDLDAFGEILHENWVLKRGLTDRTSNSRIDDYYDRARKAGAAGGKLLGAGEDGFLAFYTPSGKREQVRREMADLKETQFGFDRSGSQVVFYH